MGRVFQRHRHYGKDGPRIASSLAAAFSAPLEAVDFTAPAVRKEALTFGPDDLVVLGTPTYAGRVPNVLLPYLTEQIRGADTPAVPVVLFGNRDFDDSLMELRNIMTANGFMPVAAAAFVGEHSFSRTLGAGRPDAADLAEMDDFSRAAARKIGGLAALPAMPVAVAGAGPYPALLHAPRPPRCAHQHSEGQAQDRYGSLRRLRPVRRPMSHGQHRSHRCVAGQGDLHQVLRLRQRLSLWRQVF